MMYSTYSQTNLLAWINDKHGTNRESNSLLIDVVQILLINHVVQESDFTICIRDDRKSNICLGDLVDVFDPAAVAIEIIGALQVIGL